MITYIFKINHEFILEFLVQIKGREILFCFFSLIFFFFFFFFFFRVAPMTYGSFQARGRISAAAAGLQMLQPQQHRIQAVSLIYTTSHGNAGSPTH